MFRRRRSERGAVAVEAALVTPLLALLTFGMIEMSLLMRDAVGVTNQVRAGARMAAVEAGAGPVSNSTIPAFVADAVGAIQNAGSSMPLSAVQWVLVYQANSQGYPLPEGNTAMACTTNCIRYTYNTGTSALTYAGGTWDSSTVNACVNDANRQSVGVGMAAKHTWVTGLFGSGVDVPARLMMQFEPLPTAKCAAGAHP